MRHWGSVFEQAMEFWVVPELERRQAAGLLERPVVLRKAQVLFYPDERDKEVRINDEVRAVAKVRFPEGRQVKAGDPLYEHDLADIEWIGLPEGEHPDSGHLTIIRFGGNWHVGFHFTYNRQATGRHLAAAEEFLAAAESSLASGHDHPFVDNLHSTAELAAKALLLTIVGLPSRGTNHRAIRARFNLVAKSGCVDEQEREAFNWLAKVRSNYRYLEGTGEDSKEELHRRLEAVRRLLDSAQRRAGTKR